MRPLVSRRQANRALCITLAFAFVAWALYLAGWFGDIAIEAGLTSDDLWGEDPLQLVYPSTYLTFGAVAALTVGGLLGRRSAIKSEVSQPHSMLARPVRLFATTIAIVGLALATFGAVSVFLRNLSGGGNNAPDVGQRLLSTYLPIVLYMALVVAIILIGFVFTRAHEARSAEGSHAFEYRTVAEEAETAQSRLAQSGRQPDSHSTAHSTTQRSIALAYAVPIIAVAIALLAGLIVYDLTQQAIEAWVWLVVTAVVATGIIAGTVYAARALGVIRTSYDLEPSSGAATGAKNLNFVLSVVFTIVVSILSINFGVQAVQALDVKPSMSMYVHAEFVEPDELSADEDGKATPIRLEDATLASYGWGFDRGSQAELRYEASDDPLATERIDSNTGFWFELSLNPEATGLDLEPGEHTFTVHAATIDGVQESLALTITITSDGRVDATEEAFVELPDSPARIATPTLNWVFAEFAAPLLLVLLTLATAYVTLNARNRDEQ